MAFEEQLPQWENEGTQPPQSKRVEGWLPNEKPPASWFNWLFGRTYRVLKEFQEKAAEKVDVQQAQSDIMQLQEDLVSHENNILIHRQIHLSTNDPDPSFGGDGDIWLKYSDVPFYEHGEWTPVLAFGVPPTGLELSRQDGFYIRQGKLVTIFYYIELASKGTDGGGRAEITNLPFPNNSKFAVAGSVGEVRGVDIPDGVDFTALIATGDDTLQIRRSITTNDGIQPVRYVDFTDTARIIGQFSYFID